jgi:hypothetical protein
MHRRMKILLRTLLIAGSSMLVYGLGQKQPQPNTPSFVVWKAPTKSQAGANAGANASLACHSVYADEFVKTVHAKTAPKDWRPGMEG